MRIFTLLFLLFFGLNSQSQKTFKIVFSSSGYDEGVAAFRTSDQGYRVVGNTSTYGQGGNDVWVIALDSNADFLWQKTYGTVGNDKATDALLTAADELIIIGNTTVPTPPDLNMFVMRIDANGVLLLNHQFGSGAWDFANAVTILNDTTILVCGTSYDGPNPGYINPLVSAISFGGQNLWTTYTGGGYEEENMDITIGNNQLIILSGTTLKPDHSTDSAFVKALDSNGLILWNSVFPQYQGAIMGIIPYEDSIFATTGYHWDSTHTWREPMIGKINNKGDWLLMRDEAQGAESYFSEITVGHQGLIVIAGMSTKHTNGEDEIYLGAFDTWGWYQKSNILGGKKDDHPASIYYHPIDSTYLTCGTTKSFSVPYSGIILNQSNSQFSFDTTLIFMFVSSVIEMEKEPIKIRVFPNPTNDKIFLDFDNTKSLKLNIKLINSFGQQIGITEKEIIENPHAIDLKDLPTGIYYLEITLEGQRTTLKIIKQ